MNLFRLLTEREAKGNPIRVGIIGAGKFATMFMSQIIRTPGMRLEAVCDLNAEKAKENLQAAGIPSEQISSSNNSLSSNDRVLLTSSLDDVLNPDLIDVVIESTGDPVAGARHALTSIERGLDIVMVNVEADVLVGPLLAAKARENNVIYSLAYGDQPALIVEQVDTVRAMGLEVICAGKGTKYLPVYHQSTPATVWDYYGLTRAEAEQGGMNSKMFNSFLDGTKSGIEMAAVANATGLKPPSGLTFPPCSVDELASVLKPESEGGVLAQKGMVEVISSLDRSGNEIERDLRWGVFVVFEAGTEYVKRCFREYGLLTDSSGQYSALYRPYHLIGLELGISVASVALRRESTGSPSSFSADVAAVAKRNLTIGETLDGEGGATVWGKILPADESLTRQAVPIGLASDIEIVRPVAEGEVVTWNDVKAGEPQVAHRLRQEMEEQFIGASQTGSIRQSAL